MNAKRNIRLSIRREVEAQLVSMGYTNIYGEQAMRAGTAPTPPFAYVVDSFLEPTETSLPFLVIETQSVVRRPFELGNRHGRSVRTFVHVFGRVRGQRDDIASYLQDNLPAAIDYYDFSQSASGSALGWNIVMDDEITVEDAPPVPGAVYSESSLNSWSILSFEATLKQ